MMILENSIAVIWTSFLFYSFCGWLMETVLVSFNEKKFVNRGFLNGPFCPIYGVGMLGIAIICSHFIHNYLLVFILGMIAATTVEYITAWLLEVLFKASWWDYSEHRFNIKGRVCLSVSLYWGLLALIFIVFIQPFVLTQINRIDPKFLQIFFYLSSLIFIFDTIVSVISAAKLTNKIKTFIDHIPNFDDLIQVARELDYVGVVGNDSKSYALNAFISNIKKTITTIKENPSINKTIIRLNEAKAGYLDEIEKVIKEFTSGFSSGENRLIKAFPKLKFKEIKKHFLSTEKKGNHKNDK